MVRNSLGARCGAAGIGGYCASFESDTDAVQLNETNKTETTVKRPTAAIGEGHFLGGTARARLKSFLHRCFHWGEERRFHRIAVPDESGPLVRCPR